MNICYPISFHYEAPALIPKSGYPMRQAIDLTSLVGPNDCRSLHRIESPITINLGTIPLRQNSRDLCPHLVWTPSQICAGNGADTVTLTNFRARPLPSACIWPARLASQDALQRVRRRLVAEDATVASDDDHTVSSVEDDSGDEDDDSGLRKTPLPFVLRLGYPQEG